MQTQLRNKPISHKRLLLIAGICLAGLLAIAAVGLTVAAYAGDSIRAGVYIGETYVGGLSREEAQEALSDLQPADERLTIFSGDAKKEFSLSEIDAHYLVEDSVEQAYQQGREGNVFQRVGDLFRLRAENVHIPLTAACDETVLTGYIEEIASAVDQPQKERETSLEGNTLVVTRGHSGKCINVQESKETVLNAISNRDFSDIELLPQTVEPRPLDADDIYNEVCGDPVDATYEVKDHRLTIIPEKPGIQFDKEEARRLLADAQGDTVAIPVEVVPAKVTAKDVENSLFCDKLGGYSTNYNAGDTNRSYNIYLASKFINGTVLAPGETFSYNEIVGPRTAARGFRDAGVYVGNKVEQGIGGGICQVSSTLFNAVVLSDLNIVSRTNHSMPVSYVPRGRDATVSYGSIDFQFSNNTNSPIKIVASASGGTNSISIYGIKEDKAKSIEFSVVHTGTTAHKTVQKEDPTLPVGKTEVEQAGQDGTSYTTYKVTKRNGSVVSREVLTRSTYVTIDRIERVGTKPVEATPTPEAPAPTETPQTPAETAPPETPQPSATPEPTAPPSAPASDMPSVQPVSPGADVPAA